MGVYLMCPVKIHRNKVIPLITPPTPNPTQNVVHLILNRIRTYYGLGEDPLRDEYYLCFNDFIADVIYLCFSMNYSYKYSYKHK